MRTRVGAGPKPHQQKSELAIYRCEIKTFSRAKGQSVVAAASYRAGVKIKEDSTGLTHDYTKKGGVDLSEILTPDNSPAWAKDPSKLWNKADQAEKRKNSTTGREFLISLPYELTQEQRRDLAKDLSQNLVDRFGFAVQYSIHTPDKPEGKNHHVHILASTRKLGPDGFTEKTRELDDRCSNAVPEVREMVAGTINQHLEKAGLDVRVDHRSLLDQQAAAVASGDLKQFSEVNRQPTIKIGHGAGADHRAFINEGIKASNTKARQDFTKATGGSFDQKLNKLQQPEPDAAQAVSGDGPDIDAQLADLDHQIGELESKIAAAMLQTGKASRLKVMKLTSLKDKLQAQANILRFKKAEKKATGKQQDQPHHQGQPQQGQNPSPEHQAIDAEKDRQKQDKARKAAELRKKAREIEQAAMSAPPQEKMKLWSEAFNLQAEAETLERERLEISRPGSDHKGTSRPKLRI